jgi:hypothetical protein
LDRKDLQIDQLQRDLIQLKRSYQEQKQDFEIFKWLTNQELNILKAERPRSTFSYNIISADPGILNSQIEPHE